MNRFFSNMIKSELARASLILLILTFIGNFLSYLFQFIMARMLGPADYGTLAVLTSIVAIFGLPAISIQTVVSKYTTRFNVKKEYGKIHGMLKYLINRVLIISMISFIIFAIIAWPWAKYLEMPYWLLLIAGLYLFGAFLYPITAGILQGRKKFNLLGISFMINCLFKLISAIILVSVGFRVYGATAGFAIGVFVSFILMFLLMKDVRKVNPIIEKVPLFTKQSSYPFFAMLLIVFIYSSDVIFAKVFFSAEMAGQYSVLSMIGKIILFVIMSICTAMFPINSEKFEQGKETRGVFTKAFGLSLGVALIGILISLFYPYGTIKLLFGEQYLQIYSLLIYVVLAFSFISLLTLLIFYKLSIEEIGKKDIIILALFFILEIVLFFVFNKDIGEFSKGFMISTLISFIGGLILFNHGKKS